VDPVSSQGALRADNFLLFAEGCDSVKIVRKELLCGLAVKDLALSLLWLGLDPWPWNLHMSRVLPKKKKKCSFLGFEKEGTMGQGILTNSRSWKMILPAASREECNLPADALVFVQ